VTVPDQRIRADADMHLAEAQYPLVAGIENHQGGEAFFAGLEKYADLLRIGVEPPDICAHV